MGYNTARFQKTVDPNLICAICSSVLESPVLTPCGHSFCESCVRTWLGRPAANTCPQCRSWVEVDTVKPILSLKNLIEAMEVTCVHSSRGCGAVMSLDKQNLHLKSCKFVPVVCAGCQTEVNSSELAQHQMECSAIQKELEVEDDIRPLNFETNSAIHFSSDKDGIFSGQTVCSLRNSRTRPLSSLPTRVNSHASSSFQITRLLSRISSLEKHVGRLLDDLQDSHNKNSQLYLQYRKAKDELEEQRRMDERVNRTLTDSIYHFDFLPFEIGKPSQQDVGRLSLLMARFLLKKPNHMDCERVFRAIRASYESHFPGVPGERGTHDVHMLLATAYASNWFSSAQRIILSCWLQCVLRCQGCRQLVEG